MSVRAVRRSEIREAVAMGIAALSNLCDARECPNMATWRPGFRFWAKGAPHHDETAAEARLGLKCCDEHKAKLTVEDLVGDAGWQQIVDSFAARGKAEPDRDSVELTFTELRMARA